MPRLQARVSGWSGWKEEKGERPRKKRKPARRAHWSARRIVRPSSHNPPHFSLFPQIEGRGNGIKTNVVNNVDIAKALERPPDCELKDGKGEGRGGKK